MRLTLSLASAVACLALVAGPALATPVDGDQTAVDPTQPLLSGVGLSALGSGSVDGIGRAVLPVTGGDVGIPLVDGYIEHEGSGFALTQGTVSVSFLDLLVDLDFSRVLGTLVFDPGADPNQVFEDVVLFDARACLLSTGSDPCTDDDGSIRLNGFGLDLVGLTADVLNDAFFDGTPSLLEGDILGIADIDIRLVPEPGVARLALVAAAGLGLALRRRSTPRRLPGA
ncbi:MAG: hypothetical protein ACQGVK_24305 [Myxococcota bacterium]